MNAEQEHVVLVVPGMQGHKGQRLRHFQEAIDPWKARGLQPRVLPVNWEDGEAFSSKLSWLTTEVNLELAEEKKVSVIGVSCGGAFVIDGLIKQPDMHKVVTVCSRTNATMLDGYPHLLDVGEQSPAAADAVRWLLRREDALTRDMRGRIMTMYSSADDTVHPSMSQIAGAQNIELPPIRRHVRAVTEAMTTHAGVIVDFLKTT